MLKCLLWLLLVIDPVFLTLKDANRDMTVCKYLCICVLFRSQVPCARLFRILRTLQ